jgi:hypothetical protein
MQSAEMRTRLNRIVFLQCLNFYRAAVLYDEIRLGEAGKNSAVQDAGGLSSGPGWRVKQSCTVSAIIHLAATGLALG